MPLVVHQEGSAVVEFECSSCGHSAVAHVQSKGTGNLSSIQGEEAGYQTADQEFYENAYRLLGCVKCPRCGFVDRRHRRQLKTKAILAALLPFAALLLVTWWLMGSETDATTLQAMAIVGGGLVVIGGLPIFLMLRSRWWANANRRVFFDG